MPTINAKRKLREQLFENRKHIKALSQLGVDRNELRDAVKAVYADGQLSGDQDLNATLIAAELADSAEMVTAPDWDRIIELIGKLMPMIQTWISLCM